RGGRHLRGGAQEGRDLVAESLLQVARDLDLELPGLLGRRVEQDVAARDERRDVREPERLEEPAQAVHLDGVTADVDRAEERDEALGLRCLGRHRAAESTPIGRRNLRREPAYPSMRRSRRNAAELFFLPVVGPRDLGRGAPLLSPARPQRSLEFFRLPRFGAMLAVAFRCGEKVRVAGGRSARRSPPGPERPTWRWTMKKTLRRLSLSRETLQLLEAPD